jgi:hypothetical protein
MRLCQAKQMSASLTWMRCNEDARKDLMRSRHRLSKFLLCRGTNCEVNCLAVIGGGEGGVVESEGFGGRAANVHTGSEPVRVGPCRIHSRGVEFAWSGRVDTKVHGQPWPAVGAKTHVRVTSDKVYVWWGGASKDAATVQMRPISRQEIEI